MPGDKTNITKLVTSLCTNTNWVENTMRRLNDILPVKIDHLQMVPMYSDSFLGFSAHGHSLTWGVCA